MRKGELFRLKREDLNFSSSVVSRVIKGEVWDVHPGWLLVEKSKNGSARVIPMSQKVRAILENLARDLAVGGYIFRSIRTESRINDIKKGFVSACHEAKVGNFNFHDLRHTWSSRAAELGVPEHVRRDVLGHRAKSMTGDYTHASPEEMERAMELVASYKPKSVLNLGKISAKRKTTANLQSAVAS
jgi:integrase